MSRLTLLRSAFVASAESSRSLLPENPFDVVAVRIKNKSSVISGRMAACSESGSIIVRAACQDRCMEIVHLLLAYASEGRILLNAMRMEDADRYRKTHPAQIWPFLADGLEVSRDARKGLDTEKGAAWLHRT